MSPRTVALPPTDRTMWRKLLAKVHPDAYFGDPPAVEEMAALDVETSTLTRAVSLSLDAAGALVASITDTKERLSAERVRVHEGDLAELKAERQRVHKAALEAADQLLEILSRDKALHLKMVAAAQGVSTRTLETTAQDPGGAALHRALREKLRHFASAWVG